MPELPEVETIVRELKSSVIGKKFWAIDVKFKPIFLDSSGMDLKGLKVLDVTRMGKYIIFILSEKMRLIIHLRMTGRLMWKKVKGKEKHIRIIFTFTDGTSLIFSDIRKFARGWFCHEKDFKKFTGIYKLGIEPFSSEFLLPNFLQMFKNKKGILKNTLLRQDLIAGIGNIYADEICFRSKVHPTSRLEKLTQTDLNKIYESILFCLGEGIKHCGVSVSDFVGTRGTLGKHQKYLQVYGRKGEACYVCGLIIQKSVVAGRGTFFCTKCQKVPC